jgi:LPS export ABC transporter protein LptC
MVVVVALAASMAVFKRYLPYTGTPLIPKEPPPVVLMMEDVHLVGLGHAGKLWSVKVGKIEIARNSSGAKLKGVTDGKIYSKGKVALQVRAGEATCNINSRNLLLSEGISIEGTDGQKLVAERATWNSANSILRTNGRVIFQSELSQLTADSLVMDLRAKQLDMWNVRMSLKVPSGW